MRSIGDPQADETDETWIINPRRRYIVNANQLKPVEDLVDTISDLKSGALYNPLHAGMNLANANILVERYRDRGIGDLLFMTGPLAFLNFNSGGSAKIHFYTLATRAAALFENPFIADGTPQFGPVEYDSLRNYDYHWFVDSATEYDEESDQLNVYDALYRQIGVDPVKVDPRFKRPFIQLSADDRKNLDSFFFFAYLEKKIDLRKTGYYVVAPLTYGSLRSASYKTWLAVIHELSQRRPVVVVGSHPSRVPQTDMTVNEFIQSLQVNFKNAPVLNMIGRTPLRVMMGITSQARAVVCLDSAPLYIAQAFNIPAISVWGPHHPGVRIGYDDMLMKLAIWNKDRCSYSPCFAYDGFPITKCPMGASQTVCEPLRSFSPDQVIEKLDIVESTRPQVLEPYTPAAPLPSSPEHASEPAAT